MVMHTGTKVGIAVVASGAALVALWALLPKAKASTPATLSCPSGDLPMNADGTCPVGYGPDPGSPGCCLYIGPEAFAYGGCGPCSQPCAVV